MGENTTTLASTKRSKRSLPNTTTSTTTGNQRSSSTTAVPTDVTSNSPFHARDFASTEYGDSVHHHSTHVSSIVKYLLIIRINLKKKNKKILYEVLNTNKL